MTKKQGQEVVLETIAEIEEENANVERINQDIEADILEQLNASDGETRWRLYVSRISGTPNSKSGREVQLFNIDPAELKQKNLHDRLRDYGDGLYRARIYKNRRINNQYDIEIELPKVATLVEAPQRNDLSGIVELMRESNRQTMELFSRLEQRMTAHVPAVAAIDPMDMVTKTLAMITAMQAAVPKPENNMIEIFKMGMELQSESEGGNTPGVWSVLEKLAEKIDLSQINFTAPQSPPQPRTIEQPPPARVTPPAPQTAPPPRPMQANGQQSPFQQFVPQLGMLIQKAERGDEPELWADVLLRELPEAAIGFISGTPNIFAEFANVEPRIVPHRAWFETVLAIIKEEWDNRGEVAESPVSEQRVQPTNGQTGNATGDT